MKNLKFFLFFIFLISLVSASSISNMLWKKEFLGEVSSVSFMSEAELIISSKRGIISKINYSNSEVEWRKNMIYNTEYAIETLGECNIIYYI